MKEKLVKEIKKELEKSDYFFDGEIEQIITIVRKALNKYIHDEKIISRKDKLLKVIEKYLIKIRVIIKRISFKKRSVEEENDEHIRNV
ncbi:MAG: hypothetical protein ACI310_00760 [Bacilli bacterium]